MSHIKRIMTLTPETVLIDKYGGAEFTVREVSRLVGLMIETDTRPSIDKFLERFEVKEIL